MSAPRNDAPDAVLRGMTIVVTGVTGQVGEPVAVALARHNDVVGAARFPPARARARARLEAAGVRCVPVDLSAGQLQGLPVDADYVLNFAVSKSNDWETDLDVNCGGLALLMEHHRHARALLHCSTTAVYKPMGHHAFAETDPLGDNHGVWPFLRTYSIGKIASEATARWGARRYEVPTIVTRLSVPYGERGGWPAVHLHMMIDGNAIPVHVDVPSVYHPIHEDDIVRMLPALLSAASVPATVVNWGGDEPVSIEQWCTYLGELTGLEARFEPTASTIDSGCLDLDKMHAIAGRTTVDWRVGMRRMVGARHGDLLKS
jgi:nucleoside-diphosphate-sugar epimerase